MKRKVYRVVCGSIVEHRYSWGSALRAIPGIIRGNFPGRWAEVTAEWEKHQWDYVGGTSQWVDENGNELNFSIYTS